MSSISNSRESGRALQSDLSWSLAVPALLGGCALVIAIYFETATSLVRAWHSSDLYGHGFLVLPGAGYMLWRRRHHLRAMPVQPFIWGLAGIGFAAFLWSFGRVTATNTLSHLGLIGMLQGFYVTIFGPAIARKSAYPLLFLFMALPFGGALIEPLQLVTARGAVHLLQMTNIPVHLDGNLLAIPAGRFHVTEACAGLRFLLSTIALAWLAADLLYASPWRRALFFGLAIIVPLGANTLRAYSILLIATLRGPGSAATFDHVTYGLVFLGFVMLLLLLTGLLFRDRNHVAAHPSQALSSAPQSTRKSVAGLGVFTVLALIIAALPALSLGSSRIEAPISQIALVAPKASAPWNATPDMTVDWRPSVPGVDAEFLHAYVSGASQVALYVGYFAEERQGAEVVNELIDWVGQGGWRKLKTAKAALPVDGALLETPCLQLARGAERRVVCYWYWVDGQMIGSPYMAKILRARAHIFGGQRAGAIIALSSHESASPGATIEVLRAFLGKVEPLDRLLFRAAP